MTLVAFLCLLLWALVVVFSVLGTIWAIRFVGEGKGFPDWKRAKLQFYSPPISILKPMKNLDPGIEECLEGFFRLDYPQFELIFCIAKETDPAYPVAKALISKYPQVQARLLVGEARVGFNPKIDNLMKGYQAARYEWVLISDCNVLAQSDYLKRLASYLGPGVGLVTSSIAGVRPKSLGARFEGFLLNGHFTRWAAVLNQFKYPPISGKVMLFQRAVADQFGGLKSLSNYLAEDFMFGEMIRKLGLQVVMTSELVVQNLGAQSLKTYWERHLRWGRLRRSISPVAFTLELLTNSVMSAVLGGWGLKHLFGVSFLPFLTCHLSLWFLSDLLLTQKIEENLKWYDPLLWLMREFVVFPHWIATVTGNTVNWRGTRLKVGAQSLLEPVYHGDLSEPLEASLSLGSSHQ